MKKVRMVMLIVIVFLVAIFAFNTVAYAADGDPGDMPFDFWSYIADKVLYLIPALYFVGFIIKKIPGVPDWMIPFVLLVLGILAAMAIMGWTIEGIVQGVLVTAAAVLANQLWKQGVNAKSGTG